MPRAEIYIEDAEDGEGLDVRFAFLGGFGQDSGAHRMANMIRAYLDTVMVTRAETPIETQVEPQLVAAPAGLQ